MTPTSAQLLRAAVAAIGGTRRPGQERMSEAITETLTEGVHLLVQAGTGTGKSLGYLAPVLAWVASGEHRAVVATATLALQAQLINKDIPAILDATSEVLERRPRVAVLKGRSNYACLYQVRRQELAEQDLLLDDGSAAADISGLGKEVLALRTWAEDEFASGGLADRDTAPPHSYLAWQQVSVSARECLGAAECPFAAECFVEESRRRAQDVDIIVTNHALLAIDALHGGHAIPPHECVIIDEAHELCDRVTSAASQELSPQQCERAAKRAAGYLSDATAATLTAAIDDFFAGLADAPLGRLSADAALIAPLQGLAQAVRAAISGVGAVGGEPDKLQTAAALQEIFDIATRLARLASDDVVWVSERERFGRQLVVAPLSVAELMRNQVFANSVCVLTSATLTVGGRFEPLGADVGFRAADRCDGAPGASVAPSPSDSDEPGDPDEPNWGWRAIDVGSPFEYPKQGICYVARELKAPSRAGIAAEQLDLLTELIAALGGRTLGLFAAQRSATAAAAHVRSALGELTVLCQGEGQLAELTRQFRSDPNSCLFGTMSLWQGLDVPGAACQLVVIDKIPFPRPDDPLLQARQEAATKAGRNGFMTVAATHAGLLLAQGAGRLIRTDQDRGVVAILDPRLMTARYGSYLRASLPPFWLTTDKEVALAALKRLAADQI